MRGREGEMRVVRGVGRERGKIQGARNESGVGRE